MFNVKYVGEGIEGRVARVPEQEEYVVAGALSVGQAGERVPHERGQHGVTRSRRQHKSAARGPRARTPAPCAARGPRARPHHRPVPK